jgi:hypothetical protein
MIDEFQSSLAQKRGEMTHMNQESGWYDNTGNLYPIAYPPRTPFDYLMAIIGRDNLNYSGSPSD